MRLLDRASSRSDYRLLEKCRCGSRMLQDLDTRIVFPPLS